MASDDRIPGTRTQTHLARPSAREEVSERWRERGVEECWRDVGDVKSVIESNLSSLKKGQCEEKWQRLRQSGQLTYPQT